MSKCILNKEHLQTAFNFFVLFSFEENCCWIISITSRTYGDHALSQNTCVQWFWHFKNWWFWCYRQRTWKTAKKYEDVLKPRRGCWYWKLPQQLTSSNHLLLEKRPEYRKRQCSHFSSWQCSITHRKNSLRHIGNSQLGSSTPCSFLTRLGSFQLPLVCIDGSGTHWAAL